MKHLAFLPLAALALLTPAPARAQLATTTFVSGFGFDTNPCTVAAPCRSFQHAHDMTAAGGQITMLDPAGYGVVSISKAISIVNDGGGEAGITDPDSSTDAIQINAGTGDVVNLRGLTLNGVGTGRSGINFVGSGALNIQNCVIRDFLGAGVEVKPPGAVAAAVAISDTTVSNNNVGVLLFTASAVMTTYLQRVAAVDNGTIGVDFNSAGVSSHQATIVDSVAVGNGASGFTIRAGAGGTVALINSKAIGNGIGLNAFSGAAYISGVTLSGNGTAGFNITAGTLNTFGDNYIIDTTNTGILTPITLD